MTITQHNNSKQINGFLSKPQPQLNLKTTLTVVGFDTNMTLQPPPPPPHHRNSTLALESLQGSVN